VDSLKEERVCCVMRIDNIREPIFANYMNLALAATRATMADDDDDITDKEP